MNGVNDQEQKFPPKGFFLVVWVLTLLFTIAGLVVSAPGSVPFWIWIVLTAVALRQIWSMNWIMLSHEGIRSRNLFQYGKQMSWSDITSIDEREIPVRKDRSFYVMKIFGQGSNGREERIMIDSDIVGYQHIQEIVRSRSVNGSV